MKFSDTKEFATASRSVEDYVNSELIRYMDAVKQANIKIAELEEQLQFLRSRKGKTRTLQHIQAKAIRDMLNSLKPNKNSKSYSKARILNYADKLENE